MELTSAIFTAQYSLVGLVSWKFRNSSNGTENLIRALSLVPRFERTCNAWNARSRLPNQLGRASSLYTVFRFQPFIVRHAGTASRTNHEFWVSRILGLSRLEWSIIGRCVVEVDPRDTRICTIFMRLIRVIGI